MTNQPDEAAARKELLKSAYRRIEDLRGRLAASENRVTEPVAIVGMSCRFPRGVTDADSYWRLLSSGMDGITDIPSDRWNVDEYYDPNPDAPAKMYVRRGGFIDGVRGFDPPFFHVSPSEAAGMDPQQRLLLELTWEALENAGQAPDRLAGTPTGVFVGMAAGDYMAMALAEQRGGGEDMTHAATGGSSAIAAGRISYFYGLHGPCFSVDTACASALTAIHLAVQSLRKGESKMALAASVNLVLSPITNIVICKARMLSPDGKCKAFDANADGYVRSEGCSAFVLKLLSRAQADGDRILAVIRGAACNQDGRTNGITAPNGNAQREVIKAALAEARLSPGDVDYVETHGTGTSLGDPIEMQALGEVFARDRPANRKLILGAAKSNVGHLEAAAGAAALAKVIIALQKGEIPANLHFNNPNPLIAWDSLPFVVAASPTPWPASARRRLAGVSAFGFSGTNVHLVIEEPPPRAATPIAEDRPCHLLTLSAQAPKALSELAERYLAFLNANPDANLADLCFTANTGRANFAHRLALVAATTRDLKGQLDDFLQQRGESPSAHAGRAPSQPPPIALFISAESASDAHRQLYRQSPVFKAAFDACAAAAKELFGVSLPSDMSTPGDAMLSFALTHAMAAQWRDWGIEPAAVDGRGVGKAVAAIFTGAVSLYDGLRLAVAPNKTPEPANPLTAFQKQGLRLVLAPGLSNARQLTQDLTLTCIAPPGDGWSGLLCTIGDLYVAGISLDWQKFESPWRRERIALPTYPFQRQECWLKKRAQDGQRTSLQKELHPLLGRRVYSPQLREEIVFEAEFDTERLPMLKDHRFFSAVVVPAAVMLEMAAAAGRIALGRRDISVNDFIIEQPLLMPEGQTNLVQTVLTPNGPKEYSFVIVSADMAELENATWKRHCSGRLAAAESSGQAAEPGILDRLRARYLESREPDWFYSRAAKSGAEYGPWFQLIRTIHGSDQGSLTLLRLPPERASQAGAYGLHPGLLDAALQSSGVWYFIENPDSEEIHMPLTMDCCRMPLESPREMWVHTARRPGSATSGDVLVSDFVFYSAAGELIGELRGAHFKRNAKKDFMKEMDERRLANWLFDLRWEPLPALASADAKAAGRWLIVSDGNPAADEFASVIRQRGGQASISAPARDCDALLDDVTKSGEPLQGVAYFAASRSNNNDGAESVPGAAFSGTKQLLHLTLALAKNGAPAALALVTEGFQAPDLGTPSSLAAGAAWGLGRVIAAELPDLRCKLIDLDLSLPPARAAEMLADELLSESDENQVALGEGTRLGLRLASASSSISAREKSLGGDSRGPVKMEIGARGDFDTLRLVPQQIEPPGPGQVQMRILATSLNFRNLLIALDMDPADPKTTWHENVGEIVALGPGVTGWNVGDGVLALPRDGFCTFTNSPVEAVFKRPPNLTLPEAATLLMAYLTGAYALHHFGRIKPGDRVLIHAAAGGVGLAAVQLARHAGAEIFATAGSAAKREYLRELGIRHVMDSRSLDFAAQVREFTGGEGLDLVLNTLTGQAALDSLALLRPGGRFLEIGKTGLLSPEQAAAINPDASYHVIDLLDPFFDDPELLQRLFAEITGLLASGAIRPLPHRTFSMQEAAQAYRHMAAARHIGKLVVVDRSATPARPVESSGTYLITGGLGGLGLAVAKWMVAEGARRIVLAGRSAPNPAAETAIRELTDLGAEIIVARVDVADRGQVADLLQACDSPSAPLRGVIHAAGVLDDGALLLQDWTRFERVLRPKIDGAWNLHELTLGMPLDFFVLFSSGAGLLGNPGQSSYAAGNVFLDALATARRAAGLPALSIDWGAWADVGMAAALDQRHVQGWDARGWSTIGLLDGLTILRMLMTRTRTAQMAVLPIQESALRKGAGHATPPLFRSLVPAGGAATESAPASISAGQAAQRLREAAPADKRGVLIELVGEMVSDILGFDRDRSLPPDQNLTTLGMDSLLAIQLSNRLKTSFATAVPATLTFQYPTIEGIADYLLGTLSQANGETQPPAPEIPDDAAELARKLDSRTAETLLANLDHISDRDVEKLLGAMETKRDPE